MMGWNIISIAAVVTAFASSIATAANSFLPAVGGLDKRAAPGNNIVLIPLPNSLLTGKSKRANDFSGLTPDVEAKFLFGAPVNDENAVLLAQMKLSGKQDRPVVAMENFEHITSAVECNDSDGKMSMTFVSPEALEAAKSAWKWLSEEKGNEFLLVANHDGCGPNKERVPYRVFGVEYKDLTATFAVQISTWDKTQANFELDFAKSNVAPAVSRRVRLHRRGWFTDPFKKAWEKTKEGFEKAKDKTEELVDKVVDKVSDKAEKAIDKTEEVAKEAVEKTKDIAEDFGDKAEEIIDKTKDVAKEAVEKSKDFAGDVGDKAEEIIDKTKDIAKEAVEKTKDFTTEIKEKVKDFLDWDASNSVAWKFDSGVQGQRKNIYTDKLHEFPQLVIDCVDCYISGSVLFTGHLKVENGVEVKELSFSMDPDDIKARMELNIRIAQGIKDWTFSQSVFELSLGGIVIPGFFTFGPKLDFEVGATIGSSASLNFTVGAQASVPKSAIARGDLVNREASTAEGFDAIDVSSVTPKIDAATGGFNAALYVQPVFSLGFSVMNNFGLEASLKLRIPTINANATAIHNVDGACPGDKDKKRAGVALRAAVAAELWLFVGEDKTIGEKKFFDKKLWGKKQPLADVCFPFDVVEEVKAAAAGLESGAGKENPVEGGKMRRRVYRRGFPGGKRRFGNAVVGRGKTVF